ncbi:hypothetical protein JJD41_21700 [Oxynema sp. CENA135]|jgi:hypothetical protein|uniref:Uncharacterized protein n=1 Tax=Oxynema aestuarii AP17 TaxID=2064643 RepID=A0A6H1U0M9_9CYAN|nr:MULTISPECIES: hypothetical protein [Oxynema]MBK4732457.1 hypothetical protein [Oxynema sp. CENA135]QIZ72391.1 hypothetical protein HCG48_18865 [Oxynema aestuarii AP17]RMH71911.1 MAG: hypothetical protein D6680_20550 [Cyanobacteria bacterium J007]
MFLDELTPVIKELSAHPIAFLGGFCSGALRLNLWDDPVKSWLQQQGASSETTAPPSENNNGSFGSSSGPQSISID